MNKLWINLPVKDIEVSKRFYKEIGFRSNPMHENRKDVIGLLFGEDDFVVMLFPETTFQQYTSTNIADTSKGVEVLFSFDLESKEKVDSFIANVEKAGGNIFGKPSAHGNLYGAGFADPDGHRWNVLFMGDFFKNQNNNK